MWLLITFIIIWVVSPGPVAVMTLHETRKHGRMAGIAVAGGATITSLLMVILALLVHVAGFSTLLATDSMVGIERMGALGIIGMGLYAGYKSLLAHHDDISASDSRSTTKTGFVQGMMVMATYIPQALVYYNLIVPQTVEPQAVIPMIVLLGTLKVALMFGWHSGIAVISTRTRKWTANNRFGKLFEVATAGLIIVLGINILI